MAGVAQLVEQLTCNEKVEGSIPFTGTKYPSTVVSGSTQNPQKSTLCGFFVVCDSSDSQGRQPRGNTSEFAGERTCVINDLTTVRTRA